MRVMRLHAPKNLKMHDEPIPQPRPGEVQIKVMSVGVCASDVHWYKDGRIGTTKLSDPLVLGHEASGVITALGEGVATLAVGDRVAIEPAKPCMQCEFCLSGNFNVCPDIPFFGTPPTDGAFRDYITWPATLALKVPDSLSYDDAAMAEPLAIGKFAAQLAKPEPGETAFIIGAGAIGLSVLQALKIKGIEKIIVSEPIAERRAAALALGATAAIDPNAQDVVKEAYRLTDQRGADFVAECAGSEDSVRQASMIARVIGRVLVVGIPDGDDYVFDASAARRKQLTAIFVRRSNNTTEETIELVAEGKMNASALATHRFPLEKTADALEFAAKRADGVIRAVVVVNE